MNNLSGLFGPNNFGFPVNQGSPWSEQITQVNTLFVNMRWYLVTNFRQPLSQAYVEIGLIQTVVDVPVDDALRGGIEIKSKQLDEAQIEELLVSIDRDDDLTTAANAAKWNRLFGGAAILIFNDQDPEEPLDISSLNKDSENEFRAADVWELTYDQQNIEGYDPTTQLHTYDYYSYYGKKIHKSRVMQLKGMTAPSFIRPRLRGWGFSVVEALIRSINQYLKATDLGFEVLDEFKLDVYKIKNLVNTLISPQGEQKVRERMLAANYTKNYQNAIVMDSEDDFDHKQLSFAGLAEAMSGIRMQVASDMRMPITKLFGTSVSAGFSTDQNDMENYNAMVESQVRNKLKYHILRMCEIKCQILFGFIPDDLTLAFKPLRELGAEQEENVRTQKFNRLIQAKTAGELTTQEFRDACNKGNLFDIKLDTSEDGLNPDDPELGDVVEDRDSNPDKTTDTDNPGVDRAATKKPKATELGGIAKGAEKPTKNSSFERELYEKDGGDAWLDPKLEETFRDPQGIDYPLWEDAKLASQSVLGAIKWQFVVWWYRRQGGKFWIATFLPTKQTVTAAEKTPERPKTESIELQKTSVVNSPTFDRKAYEADGGDAWIDPRRKELFMNPGNVDEALWAKAKEASVKSLGKEKWQFITWWYKRQGGKFK